MKITKKGKYALVPKDVFDDNCRFIATVYKVYEGSKNIDERKLFQSAGSLSRDIRATVKSIEM